MNSGITLHIPLEEVETISRPACLACREFANDYADVSVGGLGSPDGYTTTIVRTLHGERIFNGAKQENYIEELSFRNKGDLKIHKTQKLGY